MYTKDNPKLVGNIFSFEGVKTFSGVAKDENNNIIYYLNGKWHREGGPAIIWNNGDKEWLLNSELHREDGPAIEYAGGTKQWLLNNKHHREEGPAIESCSGHKSWILNDKNYGYDDDFTNESWIRFVKLELLK